MYVQVYMQNNFGMHMYVYCIHTQISFSPRLAELCTSFADMLHHQRWGKLELHAFMYHTYVVANYSVCSNLD